jgi:hypothetical protein
MVRWYSGTVVQWYSGTVVQWYSGTVVQWYSGTLAHESQSLHRGFEPATGPVGQSISIAIIGSSQTGNYRFGT